MNEQLQTRLGEYLLADNVHFSHVTSFNLDTSSGTLDIWYRGPDDASDVFEVHNSGLELFLTFLVTGGK